MNGQQPELTAEQLEAHVQQLAFHIEWSTPPRSDTISPARQMQNAQNSFAVVVNAARKSVQPAPESAQVDVPPSLEVVEAGKKSEEPEG